MRRLRRASRSSIVAPATASLSSVIIVVVSGCLLGLGVMISGDAPCKHCKHYILSGSISTEPIFASLVAWTSYKKPMDPPDDWV